MLTLSRLDLSGFKTFVDPVGLDFAGGITAIVGPNGCGKSNLSDAITWVLGEQSAKSLRGESMEDVIFNGSERRRQLGMAEVTLTLATDPGFAGAQDGKISIGRRVFRSGESQYRLNGKNVRLKDVRDLLMDTGLGLRAYSVIEQGRIGMILSGKPQERRRLIEEAAGVTRYKARKQVAEVKLEEATANLLRLEDVIGEVERALRSLKRQAATARRFEEQQASYRRLLRAVLVARGRSFAVLLGAAHDALATATRGDEELVTRLARLEADLAAERETVEAMQQALQARGSRQAELAATIEGRQEFLKGARQTLQEIAARYTTGQALAERRQRDIDDGAALAERLAERRAELEAELAREESGVERESAELAAVEREFAATSARLDALRSDLLASLGELTRRRNELHRQEIEAEKAAYRERRLSDDLTAKGAEVDTAVAAVAAAANRVQELAADLETQAEVIDADAAALAATREQEADGERRVRALEESLAGLRQRRQLLLDLGRLDDERRGDLLVALDDAGVKAPLFLADRLHAPARWARSLDLFLGELADAVLLAPEADGLALARTLAHARTAARLVRPLAADEPTPVGAAISDPAVVATVGEILRLPAELAAVLPPAYLVTDAAAAERLARRHPQAAFVAPDEIWAQGGVLHVQAEAARPGLLARDAELGELATRQDELAAELDAARGTAAALTDSRRRGEGRHRELEAEAARLRQEQAVARARQEDAGARLRRLQGEAERLTGEQTAVRAELARLAAATAELRSGLEGQDVAHREREAVFDGLQAEGEEVRQRREALRATAAARRGQLVLLHERLRGHDAEVARVERDRAQAREQLTRWEQEARELQRRQTELDLAVARAQDDLQGALERRATVHDELLRDQQQVDAGRAGLRQREAEIHAVREERERVRAEAEGRRLEAARLAQESEHLGTTFHAEFGAPLADALATPPEGEVGNPPAGDDVDLAGLEAELAEQKAALERIGPVNVLAAQEYAEQEERQTFLTTQRADVRDSVERLRQTIREINQASSARFREAFAQVNAHFSELFAELFRGGEAEMRLLDDEDLLETGIEIVARPPGKRPQNLMLLSGGEKALTAIALLFALFRIKPSPFCILDEVDAPLDDVNTLRFVDLLAKMSKETQFLVITHNKLTMEVASRLYGVTMEERGISKLVAVTLDDVAPAEERAASA